MPLTSEDAQNITGRTEEIPQWEVKDFQSIYNHALEDVKKATENWEDAWAVEVVCDELREGEDNATN